MSRGSCTAWIAVAVAVGLASACGRLSFDAQPDAALPDAPVAPNIVFVTSTQQNGALGGLAGADAICQALAQEAGHDGTYVAWLSSSEVDAIDRVAGASGWVRPDGRPVVQSVADIALGRIWYPPRLDEHGNDLGSGPAITATAETGRLEPTSSTCNDWTQALPEVVDSGWFASASGSFTDGVGGACDSDSRMYCFGIDRRAVVAPPAVAGRLAFITTADHDPSTGIAGADALCAVNASNAELAGTFRALLATTTASAASRFDPAGAPWVRPDGVPLADTAQAFFTTPFWHTGLSVNASGGGYYQFHGVWTGAPTMNAIGTPDTTCGNWSTRTGTGGSGSSDRSEVADAFGLADQPCSSGYHIFCLQE